MLNFMEIDNNKWITLWNELNLFKFDEFDTKRRMYIIDPPPPFTSGEMHMGQVFWVTYIDSIARYMRMNDYNVLYPLGWDTQGFPTEIKVEKKYGKGIGREEFYRRCVEVATENMKIMKRQMLTIGASFDDKYEYITFTEDYRRKVQLSIIDMFEKSFVYRGKHPVEWCSHCGSGIAREETVELERDSALNYIVFKTDYKDKTIDIATTRPELLHACVAIAINPENKLYRDLIGKNAITPIFNKQVPIIAEESVDLEFGTGAEMICTFGDKNDVILYYKHKLAHISAMDKRGRLLDAEKYTGMKAEEARIAIINDLKLLNIFKKAEPIKQSIKLHDRCNTPIELLSSTQWFMRTKEHAKKIREIADQIKWTPETAKQILYNWTDYIEWDWNISRSRVFGTPIPFWYCNKCEHIIAADKNKLPVNPALIQPEIKKCPKCGSEDISGETDTCDCWIDSSITPLVVAGWPDNMELFKRAFPTTIRILGTEIVRTWAFYTIYRTWALKNDKPFDNLIVHGLVLGTDGREMHKSFGNGVSPDELLKKYSVDNIRLWVTASGRAEKNRPFSYEEINHGKAFITKLYNSALFIKQALAEIKIDDIPSKDMGVFDLWILSRTNEIIKIAREGYESYDLYLATSKIVEFYWHEFCDYYIENVKYRLYSENKDMEGSKKAAAYTLFNVLSNIMKLLAPVMPFTIEEINSMFSNKSIFLERMPKYIEPPSKNDYVINGIIFSSVILNINEPDSIGALLNDIIAEVRKAKASMRIALNKEITAININVAEAYYSAVSSSKTELEGICKAKKVNVSIEHSKGTSKHKPKKGAETGFSVKIEI